MCKDFNCSYFHTIGSSKKFPTKNTLVSCKKHTDEFGDVVIDNYIEFPVSDKISFNLKQYIGKSLRITLNDKNLITKIALKKSK